MPVDNWSSAEAERVVCKNLSASLLGASCILVRGASEINPAGPIESPFWPNAIKYERTQAAALEYEEDARLTLHKRIYTRLGVFKSRYAKGCVCGPTGLRAASRHQIFNCKFIYKYVTDCGAG